MKKLKDAARKLAVLPRLPHDALIPETGRRNRRRAQVKKPTSVARRPDRPQGLGLGTFACCFVSPQSHVEHAGVELGLVVAEAQVRFSEALVDGAPELEVFDIFTPEQELVPPIAAA